MLYKESLFAKQYFVILNKNTHNLNEAIITITSDWGNRDFYRAAVEGSLMKKIPGCRIFAVSHEIASFDTLEASYALRNAWHNFPDGSIHIIAVRSEASIQHQHVMIEYKNHYFIGADNGIFGLVFDEKPDKIVAIDIHQDSSVFTFPSKDVFVLVAAFIAEGKNTDELGQVQKAFKEHIPYRPVIESDLIKGIVIHIDRYGNAVTNITQGQFKKNTKNRRYQIKVRGNYVDKLVEAYEDAPEGEMLAVFGSSDLLEIAINQGRANDLLGIKIKDTVRIEFG